VAPHVQAIAHNEAFVVEVQAPHRCHLALETLRLQIFDQLLDQHVFNRLLIEGIGREGLKEAPHLRGHHFRGIGDLQDEHRLKNRRKR